MTSITRRATPSQARIMRAVRGAVSNAADAHPHWNMDRRFASSIAKRAAGTLTAQWPDVLAAGSRQEANGDTYHLRRRGGRGCYKASPIARLVSSLSRKVNEAKRGGDSATATTLIDVLREISLLRRGAP